MAIRDDVRTVADNVSLPASDPLDAAVARQRLATEYAVSRSEDPSRFTPTPVERAVNTAQQWTTPPVDPRAPTPTSSWTDPQYISQDPRSYTPQQWTTPPVDPRAPTPTSAGTPAQKGMQQDGWVTNKVGNRVPASVPHDGVSHIMPIDQLPLPDNSDEQQNAGQQQQQQQPPPVVEPASSSRLVTVAAVAGVALVLWRVLR